MRRRITLYAAAIAAIGLLATPVTMAGAATPAVSPSSLWVSNVGPLSSAPGSSCSHAGYSTIQAALTAAPSGATVHVCTGTYTEQLVITHAVSVVAEGSVSVVLPAAPANATTACDTAIDGGAPGSDEVSICSTGTVKLTGLNIQALWPAGTCNDNLYGILVAGGATLSASNVSVNGAGASPINGCQGGVGIEVGASGTTPAQVGTATLKSVTVSGYQKNGITVDGAGSSASISTTTVVGAGATDQIGQNGIQISDGAKGVIKTSNISGNECDYPDGVCGPGGFQTQATGVLFYGAAPGSSVSKSTISGNDDGVYYLSLSPTEPASNEVTITKDTFNANRYEQVVLDAGRAVVSSDTLGGASNVGIQTLQYDGQAYAPASSATKDTITGAGVGVEVLSDNAPSGDFPGTFLISKSMFLTGNTVATSNNSSNFIIGGVSNS